MSDETPTLPERRFCQLSDDLRERLRAVGIEQRDLRFEPHPTQPRRWLVSYSPPPEERT